MIRASAEPARRAASRLVTQRPLADYLAESLRRIPGVTVKRRGCLVTITPIEQPRTEIPVEHQAKSCSALAPGARDSRGDK